MPKGGSVELNHGDVLFRVHRPSELGPWSYEVADAKLARRAKPYRGDRGGGVKVFPEKVRGEEPPARKLFEPG